MRRGMQVMQAGAGVPAIGWFRDTTTSPGPRTVVVLRLGGVVVLVVATDALQEPWPGGSRSPKLTANPPPRLSSQAAVGNGPLPRMRTYLLPMLGSDSTK